MPIRVPVPGGDIRAVFARSDIVFPDDGKRDGSLLELGTVEARFQPFGKCYETVSNLLYSPLQHSLDGIHLKVGQ